MAQASSIPTGRVCCALKLLEKAGSFSEICRPSTSAARCAEHFPANWDSVSRKKMLYINNLARILFAKPVSTFCGIRA
jgi:hypothetical protein